VIDLLIGFFLLLAVAWWLLWLVVLVLRPTQLKKSAPI
jgi:hypothetical protein